MPGRARAPPAEASTTRRSSCSARRTAAASCSPATPRTTWTRPDRPRPPADRRPQGGPPRERHGDQRRPPRRDASRRSPSSRSAPTTTTGTRRPRPWHDCATSGARVYRTDLHGTVAVDLRTDGLVVHASGARRTGYDSRHDRPGAPRGRPLAALPGPTRVVRAPRLRRRGCRVLAGARDRPGTAHRSTSAPSRRRRCSTTSTRSRPVGWPGLRHGDGSAAWLEARGIGELAPLVRDHPVPRLATMAMPPVSPPRRSRPGSSPTRTSAPASSLEPMAARFASWRRRYPSAAGEPVLGTRDRPPSGPGWADGTADRVVARARCPRTRDLRPRRRRAGRRPAPPLVPARPAQAAREAAR